jgi:hypothetical protein
MSDDSTDPGPDLEPTPPLPEGGAGPDPTGATAAPGDPAAGIPTTEMTAAMPPGAPPPPKGPSWKTWVAVAGGAVVVGAAAVFGISAATSSGSSADAASQSPATNQVNPNGQGQGQGPQTRFFGRGAAGTIKSIDGSTFTLSGPSGSSTVKTTAKTKVTTTEKGSSDDVKVGDTVMVVGTKSDSSMAASRVSDEGKLSASDRQGPRDRQRFNGPPPGADGNGPPPGFQGDGPQGGQRNGPPPGTDGQGGFQGGSGANGGPGAADGMTFTRGEVQSVSDGSFTVKGIDGTTVTVTTSSDTTFSITKDARVSDLAVGDTIVAMGKTSDGVVTATRIREGDQAGGFFRGGPGFRGGPNGRTGGDGSSSSNGSGPS